MSTNWSMKPMRIKGLRDTARPAKRERKVLAVRCRARREEERKARRKRKGFIP